MEAKFKGFKGQAYTDRPQNYKGRLHEILSLGLEDTRKRALFVASLNAVMRYISPPTLATEHCKDDEPEECAQEIIKYLKSTHPNVKKIGLVGLRGLWMPPKRRISLYISTAPPLQGPQHFWISQDSVSDHTERRRLFFCYSFLIRI